MLPLCPVLMPPLEDSFLSEQRRVNGEHAASNQEQKPKRRVRGLMIPLTLLVISTHLDVNVGRPNT